jgi:hypothetical protein
MPAEFGLRELRKSWPCPSLMFWTDSAIGELFGLGVDLDYHF